MSSDEAGPTARALRAIEILQARPAGVRAEELAVRLGVTERAVRRYVGILREAGIAVESIRGPHGGYRLGRGTRLPPVVFTEPEALGLVMAVLDGQPQAAEAGADDLVGSALDKVIRALPERVGRQAATLRAHASAAPDRLAARPDPLTTGALVAAVAAHRRVRLSYRSEAGNAWDAEVDPWAVVVRHGRWYLLCHAHRPQAVRTYRIDRIGAVEQLPDTFEPPSDLDPVAAVGEHLGVGWKFRTRVVFDAPVDEVTRHVRPPMGRLEPLPDGRGSVLIGSTQNPTMYAQEWLADLPLDFRVEGGPELREAMAVLAARFAAALARPAVPTEPEGTETV